MGVPQEGCLLRIFIGESDKHEGKPLYEWIVLEALSEDLPVVVEMIDTRDKLEHFLEHIDDAIKEGLATLEKAEVRFYRSRRHES